MKTITIIAVACSLSAQAAFAQTAPEAQKAQTFLKPIEVPAVAGEIDRAQIVKASDTEQSCPQLRAEVRTLATVVQEKETLADRLQVESIDRAAAAAKAAEAQAREAAQAQKNVAARAALDPTAQNGVAKTDASQTARLREGLPVAEAFTPPTRPAISPTQMRQFRLLEILYQKGC